MPHRRCRKTTAIFLCWVMTLFWCQGMVYPVNGELGTNTFEIVDIEVLDAAQKDIVTVHSGEEDSKVQSIDFQRVGVNQDEAKNTTLENNDSPAIEETVTAQETTASSDESALQGDAQVIVVQSGETLSGVAHRYETTIAEIMKLNKISEPNSIIAGQKLQIPVKGGAIANITTEPSRGKTQVTQEELELLARVIHAEARGEDFEGQVAVGAVVLNRVKDHRFPNTIHDVVYQPGAFTAVIDKQIHLTPNQSAYLAAEAALNGEDPTEGAIYYYNPRTATDRWIKTRPVVKTIGNHTFSI
ncbi:putative cell wall hydrolase [Desulfitobacterium dehalogenans ATCC 51507]|uniref:Putative cell wall hydrolase n=1 Tax=Desulfitobacterium dehalogenans (strain ATCC 51507 / DSM 9161 / JW/IU-DC1) TaxID=756499 RepID=I4ADN7_DESDJ|nr:cell wall hydrolase [Desulfitobacterium dehalogenans]AFM02072.1 putative cell wall hydrolase [Desulfitobacterium dehalogenans ATCC 51507]